MLTSRTTSCAMARCGIGESEGKFFIVCGNLVAASWPRDACARLAECPAKAVAGRNQGGYKTQLRSENEAGSKGAGLGFLTVARDA